MNLNRRNVLAGLGAAAVGTGAAFGSGAFTSIEADREATFEVADDSEAYASFEGDGDYVTNSQISFDVGDLNDDAETTLEEALTVTDDTAGGETNDDLFVWFTDPDDTEAGDDSGSDVPVVDEDGPIDFLDEDGETIVGDSNAVNLDGGTDGNEEDGQVDIDIIVDTRLEEADDIDQVDTIRIHATDEDPGQ